MVKLFIVQKAVSRFIQFLEDEVYLFLFYSLVDDLHDLGKLLDIQNLSLPDIEPLEYLFDIEVVVADDVSESAYDFEKLFVHDLVVGFIF